MSDPAFSKGPILDQSRFADLCTCGQEHPWSGTNRYSGPRACQLLARDAAGSGRGSIFLVQDENTARAAGEALAQELVRAGVEHEVLTLPGGLEADQEAADLVLEQSRPHGLIVSVGAGTINDLGKYSSGKRGLAYWTMPTAPSMNGYTSAIAAIKVDGVKRTLPAPPPETIYCDPAVLAGSPPDLRQAGYCDILAKSVSDVDWQIDSLLFSGSYCALPSALVAAGEAAYLSRPEEIRQGREEAVAALFEGLLVSGVAMALAGSSAPASGGEHLVSHFLDMREAITGRRPALHGLQVGAGIILAAACYQELAGHGSWPAIKAADLFEEARGSIAPVWGAIGPAVEKRFLMKKEQLLSLEAIPGSKRARIRELSAGVKSPEYYLGLMRRTGFALTLDSLKVSREEFALAALRARTIRERITVLDLAAQAGVLEKAVERTQALLSD